MQSQNVTIVLSIINFSLKMEQQVSKHVGEKVIINTRISLCMYILLDC